MESGGWCLCGELFAWEYLLQTWSEVSRVFLCLISWYFRLVNLLALCNVAEGNNIVLDLRVISRIKN